MAQKTVARSVAQARYIALGAVHLAGRVAREFDRHKLEIQLPPGEEPLADLDSRTTSVMPPSGSWPPPAG